MNINIGEILREYDDQHGKFLDFSIAVKQLVSTLLANESILVHSITHRCKSRQSLEKKISRPDKSYVELSDLTDIAAVRITTYFAEDVDLVAKLIQNEFLIDKNESTDKRIYEEPDRFGYSSLHFIASFDAIRSKLNEYRRFNNMRFEIQIRSILQHAWAEIEHDLGYKSSGGVPAAVRRRFARVAGLLELADSEFQQIRQSLIEYEREVPQSIVRDPNSVSLDTASMRALFKVDSYSRKLDDVVAEVSGCHVSKMGNQFGGSEVERMNFFGIITVGQLEEIAERETVTVRKFVDYWMKNEKSTLNVGIGLFYLAYVLVWRMADEKKAMEYLRVRNIGRDADREDLVKRILDFRDQ